jgi:predicted lipoprotein with Yx(FWY)xxD motif
MEQQMNHSTLQWVRRLGVAGLAIGSAAGGGAAWAYTAPLSTPPGITLVDVSKVEGASAPQFLWRRLGDSDGKPLYTYDADQPGKSSCYDACAKEFSPYTADAHAAASGDWSIVVRDDHVRQWAYQGKALYRYSGVDPLGEPQSNVFEGIEDPAWYNPASSVYSPKAGWRRAAFSPEKTAVIPTSVQLEALLEAGGFGLVDPATHKTIYMVPVSHKLSSEWQPVRAAALAGPVGQFSIVTRKEDGSRQWTYQGEALYTYAGDYRPGEAKGAFTGDKSIQAALVYRNFAPPGVTTGDYVGRGALMVTAKGQTLYYVARFHATYGGREIAGGFFVSYNEVKAQGTEACQGDCTTTWKPLMGAANAQPSGYWELIARPEGKQWVYKGSPVYTYTGDKHPGDIEGNNRSVIVYGGADGKITYANAGTDPRDPAPRIGTLTMENAVGAKPGEKASYVAGQGYVDPSGTRNGAGSRDGNPDHGAGFYWHTVPLF